MIGVAYDRSGIITLGTLVLYRILRKHDIVDVKGYCDKHDVVFDLPLRTEAPLRVECPVGHEKMLRVVAIYNYLKHNKEGE